MNGWFPIICLKIGGRRDVRGAGWVTQFAILGVVALCASGCISWLRPPLPASVQSIRDVAYTAPDGRPQLLDLYEPVKRDRPLPVIVWIHGGAWRRGSKDFCPLAYIATQNVAVASINYRLSGEAPFPAQIHDCKAAIRWLRANARKYQLDPDHIGVFGASAGGHLAALLGTTGGVRELEGDGGNPGNSSRVQAVCAFYPPTDLDQVMTNPRDRKTSTSDVARFLGGALEQRMDIAALANPNRYVTADTAPFFILHGGADQLVPIRHSELLAEALRAKGVEVTFEVVPGKGHGISAPPEVAPKIIDFFQKHLEIR